MLNARCCPAVPIEGVSVKGYRELAYLLLVASVSGCGVQQTMQSTLDSLNNSNALQAELLAAEQQIIALNQQIADSTSDMLHSQTLAVALTGMFDPNNTAQLTPPTLMIPYAQSFAQEATEQELLQTCDLMRQDAESGGGVSTIHSRSVDLTAIGLIGGLAQEAKADSIFTDEVENHGQYEEVTYLIGEGRYMFIRDGLFKPLVETAQVYNIGTLQAAAQAFASMKYIKNLPYSNLFKIQVSGLPVNDQFDPSEVVSLGAEAKQTFTQKLDSATLQTTDAKNALAVFDCSTSGN